MLLPKTWIICRVCLKQQEEMYNIFENLYMKDVWSILRDCGGVPVRKNDNFPDKICEPCMKRLLKVHIFRKDCQRAHRDIMHMRMERNVDAYELELKNEEDNCSEIIMIPDAVESLSCKNNPSNLTITTIKSSSISQSSEQYTYSNTTLLHSITEEQQIGKNFDNQEFIDESERFTTTLETNIPITEFKTDIGNIKQYCVVAKTKKGRQLDNVRGKNAKEPIVLLLKLKETANQPIAIENGVNGGVKSQTLFKESSKTGVKINSNLKLNNKEVLVKSKQNSKNKVKLNVKINSRNSKSDKGIILKTASKCKETNRQDNKVTCKVCKKSFKTFTNLRHHMYTHNKPYQCKICNMRFSQAHAFLSHCNNHKGIRPYYCRICHKSFADISNRNCHERKLHIHKKFKCTKCSKIFRFESMLEKHFQSHKPKKCLICSTEFSSLQSVRNHHQRKHLKTLFAKK